MRVVAILIFIWSGALAACSNYNSQEQSTQSPMFSRTSNAPGAHVGTDNAVSLTQTCSLPEMTNLWRERATGPILDLPIGPGDVINVSASEIDEIQNQKARVSPEGTIELPLVGTLQAAGLSETELRDALIERLKVYMKQPRVELYVENYRSRGVAVTGAVQKPGSYDMSDSGDSLMDMISLAGGLASGAAQKIVFFPVSGAPRDAITSRSSTDLASDPNPAPRIQLANTGITGDDPAKLGVLPSQSSPSRSDFSISIDLTAGQEEACLRAPARPGDVILVPVAGQVMVQGWVNSPGAFPITPGMTVLGAVSAAGGATFSWHAELIRPSANGSKTIARYSLSDLEDNQQADTLVQSGDVVLVEKSVIGALPYGIYSIFTRFGTGLAFPVF